MVNILLKDSVENISLSDNIFKVSFNMNLLHYVITLCKNNIRQGSVSQKSRSDVSGSNKKPWRQKGTGRARAGSVKSPIWRSGGVTFANKPKKYFFKINKKVYNKAFKIILSHLYIKSKLFILSSLDIPYPKTKFFLKKIDFLNFRKLLIIVNKLNKNLVLSSRNLYNVKICNVYNLNIMDFINFKDFIFTVDSIKILEGRLN